MYTYLLVLLEEGAVPFCYYDNPSHNSLAESVFMSRETLEGVVSYARKNNLFINFLCGKHRLPPEYEELIAGVNHVKIIPHQLEKEYPDGVLVLEADESESFANLDDDYQRNIILRVAKNSLAQLPNVFASLQGKFKRLNVHLVGQETFSSQDLANYEKELKKLTEALRQLYMDGVEVEVNVLSDRLLLNQMNNCEAGLRHLTVAPNGKCYICPAFYYENAESTIGAFEDGSVILAFENQRLLDIKCAPICSRCDAYHCKRCVYLNKKTTLEINTPSQEQCLMSHIERDMSRQLLNSLRNTKPFDRIRPIPGFTYRDPFTAIVRAKWNQPTSVVSQSESLASNDYLADIYEMQKKILRKLEID